MNEKKGERISLLQQVFGSLVSPRSIFRSLLDKSSLRNSILLISTIALIASSASYNYMRKLPQSQMIYFPIMTLIGIFGIWLITSSLLHVFSRVQGGKSSLRTMLILVSFASTPHLILHTLRLLDSITISPEQILPLMISYQIFENQLLNTVLNSALNKLNIFWLWSTYLQVIALQENYKISKNRSIITVIVTFIIMILMSTLLPF